MKISALSAVLVAILTTCPNIFARPGAYTCDPNDFRPREPEMRISETTWNFIKQLIEGNKNPLFLPLMTAGIYNGHITIQEKTIRALKQEFGDDIFEDKKQKLP